MAAPFTSSGTESMRSIVLVVAAILSAPPLVRAQAAPANLAAPYTLTVGDMAALILPELFKVNASFDAPVVVTFEPTLNVIDIEIFGARSTVEGARGSLMEYVSFLQQAHVPYVQRRFGVTLTPENYRLMYYDRSARGGARLIVQMDKGQLIVPPQ